MYPILIDHQWLFLPSWHAMFVLGAFTAYAYLSWASSKKLLPIDSAGLSKLYALTYVSGYFGARALNILVREGIPMEWSEFFSLLIRMGGLTFYGGFVAASLVGIVYCLRRGWPLLPIADQCVIAVFLALGIGRIGCFLNGDDYGVITESGWGVNFPNLPGDDRRIPIQLWESASVFFLAMGLSKLKSKASGLKAILGLIGYGTARFALEFFRGDYRGWVVTDAMSTSQFISLQLIAAGLVLMILLVLANTTERARYGQ